MRFPPWLVEAMEEGEPMALCVQAHVEDEVYSIPRSNSVEDWEDVISRNRSSRNLGAVEGLGVWTQVREVTRNNGRKDHYLLMV